MHEVLISYSTKDKKWADAACSVLEARGIRCWIAPRDIALGTEWGAAIITGIDACKVMVLIFSASANELPQVRREVERAISKGLTVLPCRVENVTPVGAMEYALGNTHWLDVFTPPVERQLKRLAESVRALLPQDRGASRVADDRPLAYASTGGKESLRETNVPTWNWRGKQGLVAAAGVTSFLLLAVSLTVVNWPRNNAASTPGNTALVPEPPQETSNWGDTFEGGKVSLFPKQPQSPSGAVEHIIRRSEFEQVESFSGFCDSLLRTSIEMTYVPFSPPTTHRPNSFPAALDRPARPGRRSRLPQFPLVSQVNDVPTTAN